MRNASQERIQQKKEVNSNLVNQTIKLEQEQVGIACSYLSERSLVQEQAKVLQPRAWVPAVSSTNDINAATSPAKK